MNALFCNLSGTRADTNGQVMRRTPLTNFIASPKSPKCADGDETTRDQNRKSQ